MSSIAAGTLGPGRTSNLRPSDWTAARWMGKGGPMRRSRVLRAWHGVGLLLGIGLVAGCGSSVSAGGNGVGSSVTQSTVPSPGAVGTEQPGGGLAYQSTGGKSCPQSSTDPAIDKLRTLTSEAALPKGFSAVAVVRCFVDQHAVAGDGTWQFAVAQRASSGLSEFLRLLQQPSASAPARATIACPADLLLVPDFGLVGSDGTVVRPKLPLTVCGQPLVNVLSALNGLPWKTETETKVTQVLTQTEVETGCPSAYKYLPGLKNGADAIPWSQVKHPAPNPVTVVCVFRVDATTYPYPDGLFVAGKKLTGVQGTAALALAEGASTADSAAKTPCSGNATRFAVLGSGNELQYLLELDGCHRLMFPNDYLATGPVGLFTLLAQVGIK